MWIEMVMTYFKVRFGIRLAGVRETLKTKVCFRVHIPKQLSRIRIVNANHWLRNVCYKYWVRQYVIA